MDVSAQIASLKWSRTEYVELLRSTMGAEVDYRKHPAEDFARATVRYVDDAGLPLVAEATTSWSFVGAGLRLSMELLGPEYSMSVNTLDSGTRIFFSRRLRGQAGEDLVEKQNAEQGLMPLVGSEAAEYAESLERQRGEALEYTRSLEQQCSEAIAYAKSLEQERDRAVASELVLRHEHSVLRAESGEAPDEDAAERPAAAPVLALIERLPLDLGEP